MIGLIGGGSILWLLGFTVSKALNKDALGLGDVKLVAMGGSLFGLKTVLLGLVLASVMGCLVGIPLLLLNKLKTERHIPFGPFICLGIIIAVLLGEQILYWYLSLFGLAK
jgi:leader peptidase (prepilin peptidase)/N-methyltransferase